MKWILWTIAINIYEWYNKKLDKVWWELYEDGKMRMANDLMDEQHKYNEAMSCLAFRTKAPMKVFDILGEIHSDNFEAYMEWLPEFNAWNKSHCVMCKEESDVDDLYKLGKTYICKNCVAELKDNGINLLKEALDQ